MRLAGTARGTEGDWRGGRCRKNTRNVGVSGGLAEKETVEC